MFKVFLFIVLSVILHGLIFSMNYQTDFFINEASEQGGLLLEISLMGEPKIKPLSASTKKNSEPGENPKVLKKRVNDSEKKHPLKKGQAINKKPVILNHKPQTTLKIPSLKLSNDFVLNQLESVLIKGDKNKQENKKIKDEKIKTLLNDEVSKYFYYPKSARRKNHQGKVVLMFSIESSGLINNIQVEKSSGYRALDEAAIKALKEVEKNKWLVKIMNGESVSQYTLPVVYRLE